MSNHPSTTNDVPCAVENAAPGEDVSAWDCEATSCDCASIRRSADLNTDWGDVR